ncbi:hypothetical protein M885DRAFT_588046 [Pelagophyceae sp. CCMP2097]|nr:hypothetical protein M885DRAFT_588046 [Pelagophyceae sp. CCMP2097]
MRVPSAAAFAALFCLWLPPYEAVFTVKLTISPAGAGAGLPFGSQPVAKLFDDSGAIAVGFSGFMRAEMYTTPSGVEELFVGGSSAVAASRVPLFDGVAVFKGLTIDRIGAYVLRIVAEDADLFGFAFALTAPFTVVVGVPFSMVLQGFPSGGLGGSVFTVQPLLFVVDRGGNRVIGLSEGTISAAILDSEDNPRPVATAVLRPSTRLTRPIIGGACAFIQLFINEASAGYRLAFTAQDVVLLGGQTVFLPYDITIFVGPAAGIEFAAVMSDDAIGGEPFSRQPALRVRDAGGNTVTGDETSLVVATLASNPTRTALICADCAYALVRAGVAQYSNLGLRAVGQRYVLRLTLWAYSTTTFRHSDSGLFVDSARFDVVKGDAVELRLVRVPQGVIGGGAAFGTQPQLGLFDRGGNAVVSDSTAVVRAGIVGSISENFFARIDTSNEAPPAAIRVSADFLAGTRPTLGGLAGSLGGLDTVAPGDVVGIIIAFTADVLLDDAYVLLNSWNGTANARATLDGSGDYASEHRFVYNVRPGDSAMRLDALSPAALVAGLARDPFGRAANVTLPVGASKTGSLANTTALAVSDKEPQVANVTLSRPPLGLYAPGDVLSFNVTFDADVDVVLPPGTALNAPVGPALPLFLNSSTGPYSFASYAAGSGSNALTFEYTVQVGQDTYGQPLGLFGPTDASLNLTLNDAALLRRAATPTTPARLGVPRSAGKGVEAAGVVLEQYAPRVNATFGVRARLGKGSFFAGDVIFFEVGFDRAVAVSGKVPVLLLDTGLGVPTAALYDSGSGTQILTFAYRVAADDDIKAVEVSSDDALVAATGGFVRRASEKPLVDADLSLAACRERGSLIRNNSGAVSVDGVAPRIVKYGIANASRPIGSNVSLDDVVIIQVEFDKAVAVFGSPSVRLDVGSLERSANYVLGNASKVLRFEYVVQLGDFTEAVGLQMISLNDITRGFATHVLRGGRILLNSAQPVVEAELTLFLAAGTTLSRGAALTRPPAFNVKAHRAFNETYVAAVKPRPALVTEVDFSAKGGDFAATDEGTYGVGELIVLTVAFSDEVTLAAEPPQLQLNTGSFAVFLDGAGTKEWRFLYEVVASDAFAADLDVAFVSDFRRSRVGGVNQRTALFCNATAGCFLNDRLGAPVNLTMNLSSSAHRLRAGVEIDVSAPRISDVYCRSRPSTWDVGHGEYRNDASWFTVGEELEFLVEFEREVTLLTTLGPLLRFDVGPRAVFPFATFQQLETPTRLRFLYVVRAGDSTSNLTLLELTDNIGQAELFHRSTIPTTRANYTLPGRFQNGAIYVNASANAGNVPIVIRTDRIPEVARVAYADNSTVESRIAPGDVVLIDVFFSACVAVAGNPHLWLSSALEARATFVDGSGTAKLRFAYRALEGHIALALDYKGSSALRLGDVGAETSAADKFAQRATVKACSTTPTQFAVVTLPVEADSLAGNASVHVVVDGSVPRLVAVRASKDTPSEKTWGAGQTLAFELVFSAAVSVFGAPRIRLETGPVDRFAVFVNGSSNVLRFEYLVEAGDFTSKLDYFSNLDDFRTSAAALEIPPGAWIRRASQDPAANADAALNPVRAQLSSASGLDYSGDIFFDGAGAAADFVVGGASYLDLAVRLAASDHTLRFACERRGMKGIILATSRLFDVEYAVDVSLRVGDARVVDAANRKSDAEPDFGGIPYKVRFSHGEGPGDLFGWAVGVAALSGTLVSGAPGKARPTAEVQLVTVAGVGLESQLEVQAFGVGVLRTPAVQEFTTFTDAGEITGGTFRLEYRANLGPLVGGFATVPSSALPSALAQLLMDAYPDLGLVTASRADYAFCACALGYTWQVTFEGLVGLASVGGLVVDTTLLEGRGARATGVTRIQETAYANGTWHIELPAALVGSPLTRGFATFTGPIPAAAATWQVRQAIEEDLGLQVFNVDAQDTNRYGGRRWQVTFADQGFRGSLLNNLPLLEAVADDSLLESGPGANAFSQPVRDGANSVWGSFKLRWRADDWTKRILYNATAMEVEDALEGLESIDDVRVSRHSELLAKNTISYRVTFAAVKVRIASGAYVAAPLGDLDKLQTDGAGLFGTGAGVIAKKHGEVPPWAGAVRGSAGLRAGAAYAFERSTVSAADDTVLWAQEFALVPAEEDFHGEAMAFGKSVAVEYSPSTARALALVGAPFAEEHGVREIQNISCVATRGEFRLGMLGFFSGWISVNATIPEVEAALLGAYGSLDPLHPTPYLTVRGEHHTVCRGSGASRTNATVIITFDTPPSGPGGPVVPAALDLLVVETSEDMNGFVDVGRVRRGTRQPHGAGALGAACGAAFLFSRRKLDDDRAARYPSAASWAQVARLSAGEACVEGDRLGWSVAMEAFSGVVAAGAPGAGAEAAGRVFLFSEGGELLSSPRNAWLPRASLDTEVFSMHAGDEFGYAVAMARSPNGMITLVVGAPGDSNATGAVYVFAADTADQARAGDFLITQRLDASSGRELALGAAEGDRFGCSVAIDRDTIVIGVCGASDCALGGEAPPPAGEPQVLVAGAGAVLVYKRFDPSQRADAASLFQFFQRLEPSNNRKGDGFGQAVALQNGTLIASAVEALRDVGRTGDTTDAPLRPRHALYTVETSASNGTYAGASNASGGVGGIFRIGYRTTNVTAAAAACADSTDKWSALGRSPQHCVELASAAGVSTAAVRVRYTRYLSATATAVQVQAAILEDLRTGAVAVTRSQPDARTGAYAWNVTFRGADDDLSVDALVVDGEGLVGPAADARAVLRNAMPPRVRGASHVFLLGTETGAYTEQALLRPYSNQREALYGMSAAIDGDLAAVGAPNTDSEASRLNAGAVHAYDLSFLSLHFGRRSVKATEGDVATCVLKRRGPEEYSGVADGLAGKRLLAFVWTFARNADQSVQKWLREFYGLFGSRDVQTGRSFADVAGAGTAHARASYYGGTSNASAWVDGGRDDEGLSDYVPVGHAITLPPDSRAHFVSVVTTPDFVLEAPDEDTEVLLWMPGMWASQLGDMRCRITIADDGDGLDGSAASAFEVLGAPPKDEADDASFGQGASVAAFVDDRGTAKDADADGEPRGEEVVMAVGGPTANASRGAVRVYLRDGGLWALEQTLRPPAQAQSPYLLPEAGPAEFGLAVAADAVYGRDDSCILVGAPGVPAVYAYERAALSSENASFIFNGTKRLRALNATRGKWVVAAVFTELEAKRRLHGFGAAVAMSSDVAVVGAAGLEAVYIYRRKYSRPSDSWRWDTTAEVLRSQDYDFDVLQGGFVIAVHEQGFGTSVALDRNTLIVGAPYADYGNRGSTLDAETFKTDGVDNRHLGKGAAYAFYSTPPQLVVTLRADAFLFNGSFTLGLDGYRNASCETEPLAYNAQADVLQAAFGEACVLRGPLAGEVQVSRDEAVLPTDNGGEKLAWTITFLGEAASPPVNAKWFGGPSVRATENGTNFGCSACSEFNQEWSINPSRQVLVEPRSDNRANGARSLFVQQARLQALDRAPAALFGAAVAVSGDHVLVGAPRAPGAAATTWDFETGDLAGWHRTGNAFERQPTYGDGPAYRPDGEGGFAYDSRGDANQGPRARSARIQGRYFIGTADDRPGARASNGARPAAGLYADPAPGTFQGTAAGDALTGTLTSEPLMVPLRSAALAPGQALTTSFLVGGGCDAATVYVEVLVDGVAVARETGKCDERMRNVSVNVDAYQGRALTLRIVDASTSRWGHINVDDFVFSWPHRASGAGRVFGAAKVDSHFDAADAAETRAGQKSHFSSTGAPSSGGKAVARAGGAYAFRRKDNSSEAQCAGDKELCAFELLTRLIPSDRAPYAAFGSAVALDVVSPQSYVALVGAPDAVAKTHYRLRPPLRPAGSGPPRANPQHPSRYALAAAPYAADGFHGRFTPVLLPIQAVYADEERMRITTSVRGDGAAASAMWAQLARDEAAGIAAGVPVSAARDEAAEAGAVYVFELAEEVLTSTGLTATPPRWSALELARLRPVGGFARDHFGAAVAVAARTLISGAPGADNFGVNHGAAFSYDRDVLRVRFLAPEYAIVEGVGDFAAIAVVRDAAHAAHAVTVQYQTEDLTAKGVDDVKYAKCYETPFASERGGCGDYRQTRGTLAFAAGDTIAFFYVAVVDDACAEHYPEYVQLTLSIPGAPAAVGENFVARLRIDDNDFGAVACVHSFL